jgi:hypothetical protein
MTTNAFDIHQGGVLSALSEFTNITGSAGTVVNDVESLVLDALSFAGIGSAVGSASDSLHSQLVSGLGRVVGFVETLGGTVQTVLNDYQQLDGDTAKSFASLSTQASGAQSGGQSSAQSGAQTGTSAANAANQTPATPATQTPPVQTHTNLSDAVVNSIMTSEGAGGEQGGVSEAYGFRQSSHNGYDQIMAARNTYGQGSPEEHAVVADLLSQHARQAGAMDFTDPGVQGAIASSAHMRGIGGTRAILNSMVTGDVHTSAASVAPENLSTLQQMTPDQFQQSFRDARVTYDQTVYGNTVTHQGGHTDTWWHRYGGGLTSRYDREQQLFNGISQQAAGQNGAH